MLKQLFPFSRSVAGGEGTHPPTTLARLLGVARPP